jgi:hypothetical protein
MGFAPADKINFDFFTPTRPFFILFSLDLVRNIIHMNQNIQMNKSIQKEETKGIEV